MTTSIREAIEAHRERAADAYRAQARRWLGTRYEITHGACKEATDREAERANVQRALTEESDVR